MAFAVLRAVASRLEMDGRLDETGPETFLAAQGTAMRELDITHVERPPFVSVAAG